MEHSSLEHVLDVARRAVDAASLAAMRHFRRPLEIDHKSDHSLVTVADLAAEAAILKVVREDFPDHSVLSEERGSLPGAADARWVIDPLDGTRQFTRGGTGWGPLVAWQRGGENVVAAAALPASGCSYWAIKGGGCWRDGSRCRVGTALEWRDVTLAIGEWRAISTSPQGPRIGRLMREVASVRGPGDAAGFALLLEGRADLWVEAGVQPWDLAAPALLIAEAGGCCTSIAGGDALAAGTALAAHPALHARVLAYLGEGVERTQP